MGPSKRTQSPIVTGTSVLAVKYNGGVMVAADTLGSYGGLARFTDMRRISSVGKHTLLGAGGEMSDFDEIQKYLEKLVIKESVIDDGSTLLPSEVHGYLIRLMYNRRNKFNPLWNALVVAGHRDGQSFLGTVDMIGTSYTDNYIATGLGSHLAMPLLRKGWKEDLSEGEASSLLQECMRICLYRDCRTLNRIQLGKVSSEGITISEPFALETKWDYASFVDPKAGADTGGSW